MGGTGYTDLDAFEWFAEYAESIPDGRYDVIMPDPLNDIDSGLVAFIRKNPELYGLSEDQARGTLVYGPAKKLWKQKLLLLADKCQCFFFTAHLGDEWKDNKQTGKKKAKGSVVLLEVATLRLTLVRKTERDKFGKEKEVTNWERGAAVAPSAIVNKFRLSDNRQIEDQYGIPTLETRPLLPPFLPVATIAEIRRFIAEPLDFATLDEKYLVPEAAPLTEDEQIAMKLALAEAEEKAALAKMQYQAMENEKSKPAKGVRRTFGKKEKWAQYGLQCGARVRIVELPDEIDGKRIKDVRDFFLAGKSFEDLRKLMDDAPLASEDDFSPPNGNQTAGNNGSQPPGRVFSPSRTKPTAEDFIKEYYTVNETKTLHYQNGIFYRWRNNAYRPVEEEFLHRQMLDFLHDAYIEKRFGGNVTYEPFPARDATVKSALNAVKATALRESDAPVGPTVGGLAVAEIVTVNANGIRTQESFDTGKKNARLIAAAPDLEDACEKAESFIESVQMTLAINELFGKFSVVHSDMSEVLSVLKQALAKAKGELNERNTETVPILR